MLSVAENFLTFMGRSFGFHLIHIFIIKLLRYQLAKEKTKQNKTKKQEANQLDHTTGTSKYQFHNFL